MLFTLKAVAPKGFPFTGVPLSEQPLTRSPLRARGLGFVWKSSVFPAALAPQSATPQSGTRSPSSQGAVLLLGAGLGPGAVQFPGSQQCSCGLQGLGVLDVRVLDD